MTKIFITATSVDPDTMESSSGWVDPEWSMTQLHDDKEDVRYLEFDPEFDTSLDDLIYQTIGDVTTDQNPDIYYADNSVQDSATGLYWSYTAHVEH